MKTIVVPALDTDYSVSQNCVINYSVWSVNCQKMLLKPKTKYSNLLLKNSKSSIYELRRQRKRQKHSHWVIRSGHYLAFFLRTSPLIHSLAELIGPQPSSVLCEIWTH